MIIDKEKAREIVKKHTDISFSSVNVSPDKVPPFIDFYNSYGRMANFRTHFKIEKDEIHFFGYKFHLLPQDHRVADAAGWKSVKTPQYLGWCKLKDIEFAKQHVYHQENETPIQSDPSILDDIEQGVDLDGEPFGAKG